MRSFGSDNHSGVHPRIMEALSEVNRDHTIAYGEDPWTAEAKGQIRSLLENNRLEPLFLFNGTGANVVALQACTLPFHSILCAATAHIAVDECGAPVKFTGATLKEIETPDGKLTPDLVRSHLHGFGFEHHSQPKVIAISQTTELGTAYTPAEVKALAQLAHQHDMYLFVDGTRIANACAHLGVSLKEITSDCGVDIFTLGGTKNGLMFGEALIPLRPELSKHLKYYRKQSTQLYSKMRYIAAQFIPYLSEGLWLENAYRSNAAALRLLQALKEIPGVKMTQHVQSNALFFVLPDDIRNKLRERYFFYDWNEAIGEARLVCSWDTSMEDIEQFTGYLNALTHGG